MNTKDGVIHCGYVNQNIVAYVKLENRRNLGNIANVRFSFKTSDCERDKGVVTPWKRDKIVTFWHVTERDNIVWMLAASCGK